MGRQIGQKEWNLIAGSVDGQEMHRLSQQQHLFRLFQVLRTAQLGQAETLLNEGAAVDVALLLKEELGGVPKAHVFTPASHPGLNSITALGWAAARGDIKLMEWLVQRQASLDAVSAQGRDAAWFALEARQLDALRWLLDRGASVDALLQDGMRYTRLIVATRMSDVEAVRLLIKRKARVNAYDRKGQTALHHNLAKTPYSEEDREIALLLLGAGASPQAEDTEGLRAADMASEDAHFDVLMQHGLGAEPARRPMPMPKIKSEPAFNPMDIERPEPGEPAVPQLQKVPKPPMKPKF